MLVALRCTCPVSRAEEQLPTPCGCCRCVHRCCTAGHCWHQVSRHPMVAAALLSDASDEGAAREHTSP